MNGELIGIYAEKTAKAIAAALIIKEHYEREDFKVKIEYVEDLKKSHFTRFNEYKQVYILNIPFSDKSIDLMNSAIKTTTCVIHYYYYNYSLNNSVEKLKRSFLENFNIILFYFYLEGQFFIHAENEFHLKLTSFSHMLDGDSRFSNEYDVNTFFKQLSEKQSNIPLIEFKELVINDFDKFRKLFTQLINNHVLKMAKSEHCKSLVPYGSLTKIDDLFKEVSIIDVLKPISLSRAHEMKSKSLIDLFERYKSLNQGIDTQKCILKPELELFYRKVYSKYGINITKEDLHLKNRMEKRRISTIYSLDNEELTVIRMEEILTTEKYSLNKNQIIEI